MTARYRTTIRQWLLGILAWSLVGSAYGDFLPRLEQGENLTVVAIGTSLSSAAHSTWFGEMGQWLNTRYPGKATLFNEAVSGSASKYTAAYTSPASGLDVQLGKALTHNPDVVFIEFGTNDAYTPYAISQQASNDNLQAMIDRIHNWAATTGNTVDIILQTMNNAADINGSAEASARPNLAAYCQGYRDVAAANHLLLVDHYPNWLDVYNSQPDHATWRSYVDSIGVHPNLLGTQNVIMPELQRALLSQVPEPPSAILLTGAIAAAAGFIRSLRYRLRRLASLLSSFAMAGMLVLLQPVAFASAAELTKLPGAVETSGVMETTPILYQGQQLLFESYRVEPSVQSGNTYLRLKNLESGQILSTFGDGYSFGSAYVNGNEINVYAAKYTADDWSQDIFRFSSTDGVHWSAPTLAIARQPGGHLFNSSVTFGPQGYVMAYEFYTNTPALWNLKLARSTDLATWTDLELPAFSGPTGDEMAACPAIRYTDGYYYAIYTSEGDPTHQSWYWVPSIARSKDLLTWEFSDRNPILMPAEGEGNNNSDVDLFEVGGKTYLFYCTGDQATWGHLKRAVYDGPTSEFLQSYFPAPTPEPGTLMLLSTGLLGLTAALGWKRWHRSRFVKAMAVLVAIGILESVAIAEAPTAEKKPKKLPGNLGSLMENTPVVYQGRKLLVLNMRDDSKEKTGDFRKDMYLYIRDLATNKEIARFGWGHSFVSALVNGDELNVFASEGSEKDWMKSIYRFSSTDLKTWKRELAIPLDGNEHLFNCSVCRDDQGYLMAYESNLPLQWCFKFARSKDLAKWEKVPGLVVAGANGKEMSACPAIRYFKPYYYVITTTESPSKDSWFPRVIRSKDLETWQISPKNPFMTAEEGEGTNNSDVDLIELDGKTYVYYATGDQATWGHLKRAVYPGPMLEFFESYFPADVKPVEISARVK
jgi:lysophospholipase L1-like esterase